MTFRTTTLTATLALVLGAGTALAQQETVITVPLGETATAPEGQGGFTYTATPTTDGTEAVATPSGEAPQQGTGTLLSPGETVTEAQAPAADAPAEPTAEAPVADAADEAPAAEVADAPAPIEAAPDPAADGDAEPADTATATAPAPEPAEAAAEPEASAEVASDDPAASVEGDIVVPVGDSEEPVEGAADAALGTVGAADVAAEVTEAENQAARTAGENVEEVLEEEAATHEAHVTDVAFPFEGPFGRYDQMQLQRGLQVYTEVCSGCHGMRYVPLRTLSDANGPGLPEDQVRAYAEALSITDTETGEDRPRLPTDNFPIITGEGMGPDLSLMAKARAGFHGPYGTGLSQLMNGMGGPEYIYSVLTGYTEETKDEAGSTFYENEAFAGGWIQMAPPLFEDGVTYADGTPATVENMAMDVSAFLMWAAEPKMMERKQTGLVSVLFLILLSVLLYLTNKRLWWPIKHGRDH